MQIHPNIRKQLTDLGRIPWSTVKNASAVIVEIPIGQLSPKNRGRALHVVTNAFTELTYKQQVIAKVIRTVKDDLEKAINNEDLTKEELIAEIKRVVFDPPELSSENVKASHDEGKES